MFTIPFFNIPFNKSSPQNNSLSNHFQNIKLHIKYAKINLPTFLKSISELPSMSILPLSKLSSFELSFKQSILRPLPFLKSKLSLLFKQSISILPPSTKPFTIIFDINTLAIKRFNWYTLQQEYTLKPYTSEMLFTLGYNNEIILISNINEDIINRLDPYGFIKYRYNIKNTQLLNTIHINRDMNKTIIIAQEEINKEFYNNTLIINNENSSDYNRCYSSGDSDEDRRDYNNHNNNHTIINTHITTNNHTHINNNINLNLIHFISTLNILNKDYPTIILSYKNKDFLSNFRITQLKYFKNKSLLDKQKYIEMLNEINKQRIEEYDNAKPYMEEQLIKDKMLNNKYIIDKIGYIVKGLLFNFI